MPNTFRCTRLCPLASSDIQGNPVCLLRRDAYGRCESRPYDGDPCLATERDARSLAEWIEELEFQRNALVELLEEVTGQNQGDLRRRERKYWSIWERGERDAC